jgi:hypothetical protein
LPLEKMSVSSIPCSFHTHCHSSILLHSLMLNYIVSLNNTLMWGLNLSYKPITSVSLETAFEKKWHMSEWMVHSFIHFINPVYQDTLI